MIGLYFTPISVFGGKTRGLLVLAVNSWASLTMAEVRLGLEAAGSRLQREVIDEASFWSAATPPTPELRSPTVHLLQGYDEYIMGHTETKHVLARPGATWSPTTLPVFTLVVLLDGRPAGFSRRTPKKDSVVVEVALLEPFDAAQMRALEAEAARFGAFLSLASTVVPAEQRITTGKAEADQR